MLNLKSDYYAQRGNTVLFTYTIHKVRTAKRGNLVYIFFSNTHYYDVKKRRLDLVVLKPLP